jgi:hypothetical protein
VTSILFDLTFFCWKQEEKDIKENKLWILFISFQINSILCSIRLFNMAHAIICAQCGQHIIFSELSFEFFFARDNSICFILTGKE